MMNIYLIDSLLLASFVIRFATLHFFSDLVATQRVMHNTTIIKCRKQKIDNCATEKSIVLNGPAYINLSNDVV